MVVVHVQLLFKGDAETGKVDRIIKEERSVVEEQHVLRFFTGVLGKRYGNRNFVPGSAGTGYSYACYDLPSGYW